MLVPGTGPWLPSRVRRAAGSVYHYTSADGVLAILQSGRVWASQASSLNDLGEVRQGWELILELAEGLSPSDGRDLILASARSPVKGTTEVYVLSASTAGDDANQWRLYGKGALGYVLELDAAIQLAALSDVYVAPKPTTSSSAGRRISFTKLIDVAEVTPWLHVLYDPVDVRSALEELADLTDLESAKIAAIDAPDDIKGDWYAQLAEDIYPSLATIAHLVKMPGFAGESEVRVVTTFVLGGDQITYRASAHGVVAHATLTRSPSGTGKSVLRPKMPGERADSSLPVGSVRVGPLLSEEHRVTLRGFLRQQGLTSVDTHLSQVPLRA